MRLPALLLCAALLAACDQGPSVVDGASKEAAERSLAEMSADLPETDRAELDAAVSLGWPLDQIAGKTSAEIVAMARERRAREMKEEMPALQARIDEAERAVLAAKSAAASSGHFLRSIALLDPKFTWRSMEDGSAAPLLSFNMKNDTSEAIRLIVFHATVGPGARGLKPWIDQRFEFVFADPATTGETKFVFVTPDLTQPGNADAALSRDAPASEHSFDIDFIRVEDLNGVAIMDDEAEEKAEAALAAAREALALVEAALRRLEAGGRLADEAR